MSILDDIKRDHEEVNGLFEEMIDSSPQATGRREEMAAKLTGMLTAHMQGEEEVFYPRLLELDDMHESALEALEEHQLAKMGLRELGQTPAGDERWKAKVVVLSEAIDHHIEEEEDELFDAAEDAFSDERLDEMGEEFMRVRQATLRKAA